FGPQGRTGCPGPKAGTPPSTVSVEESSPSRRAAPSRAGPARPGLLPPSPASSRPALLPPGAGAFRRQPEPDARPLSQLALDAQPALVPLDGVFHDGKAQPCPALFARAGFVHAVKALEDPVQLVFGYSDAGIGDGDPHAQGRARAPGPVR